MKVLLKFSMAKITLVPPVSLKKDNTQEIIMTLSRMFVLLRFIPTTFRETAVYIQARRNIGDNQKKERCLKKSEELSFLLHIPDIISLAVLL